MKRVSLNETKITEPLEYDWLGYFKYNNEHLLPLDFDVSPELSGTEKSLITPSIRAFQLGEGSEGKHLLSAAERFADKSGYSEYTEIMRWFVIEENRHSHTLKKYMDLHQIEPKETLLLDKIFRQLRKLTGLECEVIILVTAEMVALSYYTALSNAVNSDLLKTICLQMLYDELRHVVFQSSTLHRISVCRNSLANSIIRCVRRAVMSATVLAVWSGYKEVFKKGGYTYKLFKKHCLEYLKESVFIEKTGKLP